MDSSEETSANDGIGGSRQKYLMEIDGNQDRPSVKHSMSDPQCLSNTESFLLGRAKIEKTFNSEEILTKSTSGAEIPTTVQHIRMTEIAPTKSKIFDKNDDWRISLQDFSTKKRGKPIKKDRWTKRIKSYYKAQDELISVFEDLYDEQDPALDSIKDNDTIRKKAALFSKISLGANVVLLIAKTVAAVLSGSISIISSLIDSIVDFTSGVVIWATAHAVQNRDQYQYPEGRTKLEPIAIVILSVVMSVASLQLIRESVEKIVGLSNGDDSPPSVDVVTIVITVSAVVLKLVLFLLCRRVKSSSIAALAQDHRNDVLSNTVALICGYIGSQEMLDNTQIKGLVYVDPGGAILISIYIIVSWWITGWGQIKLLTGHTAKPDFLKKITWLCLNHHPEIRYVDTVRAFHFGNNFLVEVDIVLPEDMTLLKAHDIGEPLQQKLERLPEVERAFVHLDYNFDHNPSEEHKPV